MPWVRVKNLQFSSDIRKYFSPVIFRNISDRPHVISVDVLATHTVGRVRALRLGGVERVVPIVYTKHHNV